VRPNWIAQRRAASSTSGVRRHTWSMRRREIMRAWSFRQAPSLDTISASRRRVKREEDGVSGQDDGRRARAEARLRELGDEPGGEAFLRRMGVLGDWVVDFAFGDVHTRRA
jgi:hypothetical protein